jgi:tripartite-type tricarboxylate transporter receptor subunit TctC
MPDDVGRLRNRAVNEVLQMPEMQEKAKLFGLEARDTTPEETRRRLEADIKKWAAVIDKAGIERQ